MESEASSEPILKVFLQNNIFSEEKPGDAPPKLNIFRGTIGDVSPKIDILSSDVDLWS